MTAKCVDAHSRPELRTVCSHLPSLLRHCLQNLVQYFKLAGLFSFTSIFCNYANLNKTHAHASATTVALYDLLLPVRVNWKEASALKNEYVLILKSKKALLNSLTYKVVINNV